MFFMVQKELKDDTWMTNKKNFTWSVCASIVSIKLHQTSNMATVRRRFSAHRTRTSISCYRPRLLAMDSNPSIGNNRSHLVRR